MPQVLRVVAFLAGVCVLYEVGYLVLAATPAPWGLAWMPPLAVAGGVAWYLLERLGQRLGRRTRERGERHRPPSKETPP